jgi:hypothetical protein
MKGTDDFLQFELSMLALFEGVGVLACLIRSHDALLYVDCSVCFLPTLYCK